MSNLCLDIQGKCTKGCENKGHQIDFFLVAVVFPLIFFVLIISKAARSNQAS